MLHEIVIRDQNSQLSKELDAFLADSAYLEQERKELEP
jgi:hypothetical protein